jgi:predicted CXXCH cytochrome family protein
MQNAFPPGRKPHGQYFADTAACPQCHGLHSSRHPKLLKGGAVQELCATWHDGTGSKFNAVSGYVRLGPTWETRVPDAAGPFGSRLKAGGDPTREPTSVHDVGEATHSEAPGMSAGGSDPRALPGEFRGAVLTCISCHDPHDRAGNYRLLRGALAERGDIAVYGAASYDPAQGRSYSVYFHSQYTSGGSTKSAVYFCTSCHRQVGQNPMVTGGFLMGEVDDTAKKLGVLFRGYMPAPGFRILSGNSPGSTSNVCPTCHFPHGTTARTPVLSAYRNGHHNNPQELPLEREDPVVWPSGNYYSTGRNEWGANVGSSTVLARFDPPFSVCMYCHGNGW